MSESLLKEMWKSGTGYMQCMSESISQWEKKGYTENLSAAFDHFKCRQSHKNLNAADFYVDQIERFENASDPDDNSIIYAISGIAEGHFVKGIYIESYGLYHESFSDQMLERIISTRSANKNNPGAQSISSPSMGI
jgi:hypothetical protein